MRLEDTIRQAGKCGDLVTVEGIRRKKKAGAVLIPHSKRTERRPPDKYG
jgi:hypothetical protein